MPILYKVEVRDQENVKLGEFENLISLRFNKRLNNFGTCEITIPANDPKANTLVSLRRYSVWVYRKEEGEDYILIWSGEQAVRSGRLEPNGRNFVTIFCYDWLESLSHRFTSRFIEYEDDDAGEIAWNLIYLSQIQAFPVVGLIQSQFDDFEGGELDLTKWAPFSFSPTVEDGHLVFDSVNGQSVGVDSLETWSAEDSYIHFEVIDAGTQSSSYRFTAGMLDARWQIKNGTIVAFKDPFDSMNSRTEVYDPLIHRWFKIRWNGISVFWEYSTDGVTWEDFWEDEISPDFISGQLFLLYNSTSPTPSQFILDHFNTNKNGDMGITRGSIEETISRDRTYRNDNVMDMIINLSNVLNGFDFEITNEKIFNVRTVIGEDKSDEVVFEYGYNVRSIDIDEDFVTPVNKAIIVGEVSLENTISRVERGDAQSQALYKVREIRSMESDISEMDTFEEKGDAFLRKYGTSLMRIEPDLTLSTTPDIGDFNLGDIITIKTVWGIYDIQEPYRVFEWDITYKPDLSEQLRLVIGKFTL